MKDFEQGVTLKSGIDPEFIQTIITQDIDCKECFLDLIDNSIDAARRVILAGNPSLDVRGLPSDYSSCKIELEIRDDQIEIADNCAGIDRDAMINSLLVLGKQSNEPLAIGHFGVGLKRALLKLGKAYQISTSDGSREHLINLEAKNLGVIDKNNPVVAKFVGENPATFTRVVVDNLNVEVVKEVSSTEWLESFQNEAAVRYSIFISKGLALEINGEPVAPACPDLRKDGPVKVQTSNLKAPHDIDVFIEAGMHHAYRVTSESTYDKKVIQAITNEYGWYYVCNDRVIKIASKEKLFGWRTAWHQEYNGFVGWVHFVGDVADLPWNTKKTDIDPYSDVFEAVKLQLGKFADHYRKLNRSLKKTKKTDEEEPTQSQVPESDGSADGAVVHEDRSSEVVDSDSDGAEQAETGLGIIPPESVSRVTPGSALRRPSQTRIPLSEPIAAKLEELGSLKLLGLYRSLCMTSLEQHPELASVGAWAFLESLSTKMGKNDGTSFEAYLKPRVAGWPQYSDRGKKNSAWKAIHDLGELGNCVKHDSDYTPVHAAGLVSIFAVLEDVIFSSIELVIQEKAASASQES